MTDGLSKACRAETERLEPLEKSDGGLDCDIRGFSASFVLTVCLGDISEGLRSDAGKVTEGARLVSIGGAGCLVSCLAGGGMT